MEQQRQRHKKLAGVFCISLCCVLAFVAALDALGFFNWVRWVSLNEGTVYNGTISSDEEIGDIPEGEIRYKLNNTIVFEHPYSLGNLCFENPRHSEYSLTFSLFTTGSNELVYLSPLLGAGQSINGDKLKKMLDKGSYSLLCIATAYDENGEKAGEVKSNVSLTVQKN